MTEKSIFLWSIIVLYLKKIYFCNPFVINKFRLWSLNEALFLCNLLIINVLCFGFWQTSVTKIGSQTKLLHFFCNLVVDRM